MTDLLQDLRHAARGLAARPGFTAVAVVTLALGIGANGALFSVVDGVLLAPLPYPEPDRLVGIWTQFPEDGLYQFPVSEAELLDYSRESRLLESVGGFAGGAVVLTGGGEPERIQGAAVSAGVWRTLGVEPALGRLFTATEDVPGGPELTVLSHGLWQRRFAGDPGIVGRKLTFDGEPYTVLGVMPPGFAFPRPGIDLWVPLALDPGPREERSGHYLSAVGRLAPGATLEQVRSEMASITGRWQESYEHAHPMTALALHEQTVGDSRAPLLLLFGAVGLVLAVACANVAGLLLARGEGRRRELAVRTALGASRGRLLRLLFAESALLAGLGAALGLGLAAFGVDLLPRLAAGDLPRLGGVAIDGRVLAFTAGVALVCALACGLVPGLRAVAGASGPDLAGQRGVADRGFARHALRRGLITLQVAVAVVLVCGASLLVRSLVHLQRTEPGFAAEGVLAARVELSGNRYPELSGVESFYERALDELRALPGVESASLVNALPLDQEPPVESIRLAGEELPTGEEEATVRIQLVAPDAFRTLGIPLTGRDFTAADRSGAPRVAIVNRALARAYLPGGEAAGRRLLLLAADPIEPAFEVVGVAGDVRDAGLAAPPRPTLYLPLAQAVDYIRARGLPRRANLVVRSARPPEELAPSVRQAVRRIDDGLALYDVQTLAEVTSRALARPRLLASLIGLFSALALTLAAVGVYGLLAQLVGQRRREMGIRSALGATPGEVGGLVMRQGMALVAAGLVLGLAASAGASRTLAGLLHGVTPGDPASYLATALLLAAAALLACWLPARRAARVDPATVLRAE